MTFCEKHVHIWACLGFLFLQALFLFDRWVGHRLLPKKTVPVYHHAGKSLSLGSYGSDQGKLHFLENMFRSLARLQGGLARFLSFGFGWLQCGLGLTSRPLGIWCWTFWDTHRGPPLLQLTAPFSKDIAPLPLHPGFAPGCGLWSGVGSFQQA